MCVFDYGKTKKTNEETIILGNFPIFARRRVGYNCRLSRVLDIRRVGISRSLGDDGARALNGARFLCGTDYELVVVRTVRFP